MSNNIQFEWTIQTGHLLTILCVSLSTFVYPNEEMYVKKSRSNMDPYINSKNCSSHKKDSKYIRHNKTYSIAENLTNTKTILWDTL